jgi:hypothetical protein
MRKQSGSYGRDSNRRDTSHYGPGAAAVPRRSTVACITFSLPTKTYPQITTSLKLDPHLRLHLDSPLLPYRCLRSVKYGDGSQRCLFMEQSASIGWIHQWHLTTWATNPSDKDDRVSESKRKNGRAETNCARRQSRVQLLACGLSLGPPTPLPAALYRDRP